MAKVKRGFRTWLCDVGLKFLSWGEANFGTEDHADWLWLKKTREQLRALRQ